jgi:hypothetical protein
MTAEAAAQFARGARPFIAIRSLASRTGPYDRFVILGAAVVAIVIAAIALTPDGPPKEAQKQPYEQAQEAKPSLTTGRGVAANRGRVAAVRAVEAGLYPWQLQAPISREVPVPEVARRGLIVAGGLVANGSSAAGAFRLDTGTGKLAAAGSIATAAHDGAVTVVDGQILVFGGGTRRSVQGQIRDDKRARDLRLFSAGTGKASMHVPDLEQPEAK